MAVTLSNIKHIVQGNERKTYFDVTGPASYTTGGETVTIAQQRQIQRADVPTAIDLTKITFVESEVEPANARYCTIDKTNNKVMFWAGSTQVANATNLAAVVIRCCVTYAISNP